MARSANQKLKLLYLCRILMEQTDEDHPLSVQELIAQLAQYVANGEDLLANTDSYTKDTANNLNNKIFIPYQEYTG